MKESIRDTGRVVRFAGFRRTASDLARSIDFYCNGLGFTCARESDSTVARTAVLTLGDESIELRAPNRLGGSVSPQGGAAVTSRSFQHVAIVTPDMPAAMRRLQRFSPIPISTGGAQTLPPEAGRVEAFKFRDPDGHPLELIFFPAGTGDPTWQGRGTAQETIGLDHSAIGVANVERSIAFYVDGLGFRLSSRQVNRGPAQDRLDGQANVVVDVVGLTPATIPTPHLELLGYHTQSPRPGDPGETGRADRLTWWVDDMAAIDARLAALATFGPGPEVLDASIDAPHGRLLRDPDGRLIQLLPLPPTAA